MAYHGYAAPLVTEVDTLILPPDPQKQPFVEKMGDIVSLNALLSQFRPFGTGLHNYYGNEFRHLIEFMLYSFKDLFTCKYSLIVMILIKSIAILLSTNKHLMTLLSVQSKKCNSAIL
jgi:hypothetical protein